MIQVETRIFFQDTVVYSLPTRRNPLSVCGIFKPVISAFLVGELFDLNRREMYGRDCAIDIRPHFSDNRFLSDLSLKVRIAKRREKLETLIVVFTERFPI